jgi:hypothetical protein
LFALGHLENYGFDAAGVQLYVDANRRAGLTRAWPKPHPIPGATRLASLPVGGDRNGDVDLDCG